jgi:Uma2 family endonuclease
VLGARGYFLLLPLAPISNSQLPLLHMSSILQAAQLHLRMTPEEFLGWVDEDDKAELIDGEVVVASPASGRHQDLELFLGTILKFFVRHSGIAGRVRISQFMMRLGNNLFVPDVMYIASRRLADCRPNYMRGPADLVMEIVSPDSEERDRKRKFAAYEAAGVREYWLFAPEPRDITAFCLGPKRRYRKLAPAKDGAVHSVAVPGFFIRPEWVWADPPDELAALKELGIRI